MFMDCFAARYLLTDVLDMRSSSGSRLRFSKKHQVLTNTAWIPSNVSILPRTTRLTVDRQDSWFCSALILSMADFGFLSCGSRGFFIFEGSTIGYLTDLYHFQCSMLLAE